MPVNTTFGKWEIVTDEPGGEIVFENVETGERMSFAADGTFTAPSQSVERRSYTFPSGLGSVKTPLDSEVLDTTATWEYDATDLPTHDAYEIVAMVYPTSTSNMFPAVRVNGVSTANYTKIQENGTKTTGNTEWAIFAERTYAPKGFYGTIIGRWPDDTENAHVAASFTPIYGEDGNPASGGRLTTDVGEVTEINFLNTNNNNAKGKFEVYGVDFVGGEL